MGKYFGTDGIRGKANVELTAEKAFLIGKALGSIYPGKSMTIGMDTRCSSSMLKHAVCAGLCASGANAYDMGVVPTPAIAYITAHEDFVAGIMISASHNPYYDNGIKVFNHAGVKIDDGIETKIEAVIDGAVVELATESKIGQVIDYSEGLRKYKTFLKEIVQVNLTGLKIAIDAANGSASVTALEVLNDLGASCVVLHNQPNGININEKCGSTHPEELQAFTVAQGCDIGLAFDGDADRLIAVDHMGHLFDGDKTLYVCAKYMRKHQKLPMDTVVTTVMANLGLYKALQLEGIETQQTQVGDKYVYERMVQKGYTLGGEQSGHIIFKEHATTGDGLLTALKLLQVMVDEQASLQVLSQDLKIYPQLLKNVKVNDKKKALENQALLEVIQKAESGLQGEGRILVRPSGTEPLVRVMVEAASEDICERIVGEVVLKIQELKL